MSVLIVYVLLLALLLWGVYSGYIYSREAGVLTTAFVLLHLVFLFLKLSQGWYIGAYFLTLIYLVIKVYGGDVNIR